jgi:hypothetical protein
VSVDNSRPGGGKGSGSGGGSSGGSSGGLFASGSGSGSSSGAMSSGGTTGAQCPAGAQCNVSCTGTATTSISGKVYDPALRNGLYNVTVYVPRIEQRERSVHGSRRAHHRAALEERPATARVGSDRNSCGQWFIASGLLAVASGRVGARTRARLHGPIEAVAVDRRHRCALGVGDVPRWRSSDCFWR